MLDLNLQDGFSIEPVAALQERRSGVRIVIHTGYDSVAASLVALKAGAVGYLAKPVRAKDMEATLLRRTRMARRQPSGRCKRTGCGGSTSIRCSSNATATCRKPHAA
ncbi:MAG: response regulator [Geminicoccaceae bacterium]